MNAVLTSFVRPQILPLGLAVLLAGAGQRTPASDYSVRRAAIEKRDATAHIVPAIPPKERKLRVLIDSDARNEIDDVWAIALALLSPERFQIEGFVVANYDNSSPGVGPDSIAASARLIETILEKAGLKGRAPCHGTVNETASMNSMRRNSRLNED